jgi:hypothetical protein
MICQVHSSFASLFAVRLFYLVTNVQLVIFKCQIHIYKKCVILYLPVSENNLRCRRKCYEILISRLFFTKFVTVVPLEM